MSTSVMKELIWGAGLVHVGIIAANVPLPGRLRVAERLASVPRFVRQIFYVHWIYIVIVVGLFAVLCFGFAEDLAGGSGLGRFLSGFMAGFWLLRILLQVFYYDRELRRENRGLDLLYVGSLSVLVVIFGMAALGRRVDRAGKLTPHFSHKECARNGARDVGGDYGQTRSTGSAQSRKPGNGSPPGCVATVSGVGDGGHVERAM